MLKTQIGKRYTVWPSYLTGPAFTWAEFPSILAAPLSSGYLSPNDLAYVASGVIRVDQGKAAFHPGCFGGGVIELSIPDNTNWIGNTLLRNVAEFSLMPGLGLGADAHKLLNQVGILGPRGDSKLLELGGVGRHQRAISCSATFEDIPECRGVYWLLRVNRTSAVTPLVVERLAGSAAGFGLLFSSDLFDEDLIQREADAWFGGSSGHTILFRVEGGDVELGFHFAVLNYAALDLRAGVLKSLQSIHLVAEIDGQPNFCRFWQRRNK